MQAIANIISQYASQIGQNVAQWAQSPSGKHVIVHCGMEIVKELKEVFK